MDAGTDPSSSRKRKNTRGAPIKTVYAQQMRKKPTKGEAILWRRLRARRLHEYRFTRQRPLFGYIVDFYCPELKIAVEVDGASHDGRQSYDKRRDDALAARGIRTVRIPDALVCADIDAALAVITKALGLSPRRERILAEIQAHRRNGEVGPAPRRSGGRGSGRYRDLGLPDDV